MRKNERLHHLVKRSYQLQKLTTKPNSRIQPTNSPKVAGLDREANEQRLQN